MRLTNKRLRQLIKEELARELKEESGVPAYGLDVVPEALRRIEKNQQIVIRMLGQILNKS